MSSIDRSAKIQPSPLVQFREVPGHPLVTPVPYHPGLAEYAVMVREEIVQRSDRSFVIAVDLPHGLEKPVLEAVKRLPTPSLILDVLNRGIPILPSSAPIEAVRSFLEYGYDIRFIDASLPVTGSMVDYQGFIGACRRFGIETVVKSPRTFGVHPEELFRSGIESIECRDHEACFPHCPPVYLNQEGAGYDEATTSPYLQTRLAYMAGKILELEQAGVEVLLVCDVRHLDGIIHHLGRETVAIDDTYVVPTRTIPLLEDDVGRVTEEIPFFAYLYDLYRDTPVDRATWLRHLVTEASTPEDPGGALCDMIAYAEKVALMHGDLVPGLYHLLVAAKAICGDEFMTSLLKKAISYPPASGGSQTTGRTRFSGSFLARLFPTETVSEDPDSAPRLVDFNFIPIRGFICSLAGKGTFLNHSPRGKLEWRIRSTRRSGYYCRWKRTPESYRAERAFTRYILNRFSPTAPSDEESMPREYFTSLEMGIDIRESLRNSHLDQIYVKTPQATGNVCYIFDYRLYHSEESGGEPEGGRNVAEGRYRTESLIAFFFDRYLDWVGLGVQTGLHYRSAVLAMFTRLEVPVTEIYNSLECDQPLSSALSLGLEHGNRVVIFTDRPEDLDASVLRTGRVTCHPLGAIPSSVLEKMHEFDISHYRYDSTRGD